MNHIMSATITSIGRRPIAAWLTSLTLAASVVAGAPASLNGFALTNPQVPLADIRSGGQPRDGIPAIDRPVFVAGSNARYLRDDDLVVSFSEGGESRAYPLRILVWHEIVAWVVGLVSGGDALAFPLRRLPAGNPGQASIGNRQVELTFDTASESVRVRDAETGEEVPSVKSYWFAWQAFYPRTKVWRP